MKPMTRDEIKFWLLFFILNSFIFLPGYLLDSGKSTFIPYEGFLNGPVPGWLYVFFERENSDIFRLSIDLLAVSCAFHLLRKRIQINLVVISLFLYYLLIFLYQIYYQSIEKIYHVPPLLNNDIHLMVMSFSIFFSDLSPRSLLVLTGIIMLLIVIFFLIRSFIFALAAARFGALSRVMLITLATLTVVSTGTYGIESKSSHVFQLHTLGVIENIRASYHAEKTLGSFDAEKFLASNNYEKYALKERPNVYLLFIESYGRIMLDNSDLFRDYKAYTVKNEIRLRQKDWHSSSHLSRSPVSGGKSWISYATVLYGYNFKNEERYLALLRNPAIYHYTHLLRFLQLKGYRNYRLKSIYPGYYNMPESTEANTRFYAVDQWIRFEDLQYTGQLHGFGPSPGDQYSVNYARRFILEKNGNRPYTLFFLNQNSHRPFYSPEKVVENWENLNDGSIDYSTPSRLLANSTIADYAKAILYQIEYLTDFIIRNGSGHDIFILIGDHQPPLLTSRKSGFETPVHIISKNAAFVNGFIDYGFTKGLLIRDKNRHMKHEGIYSMFMREFIRHYGHGMSDLPVYRPNGIEF